MGETGDRSERSSSRFWTCETFYFNVMNRITEIDQEASGKINIRSFKDDDSGVLISQKRNCIIIEFDTLPLLINELVMCINHEIIPVPPVHLSGHELNQWKRIEHMKASLHHCVVGYEKKLADKEKNYQMIMRENERLLTRIETLTNQINKNGNS